MAPTGPRPVEDASDRLRDEPRWGAIGARIGDIFAAALDACEPGAAVRRALSQTQLLSCPERGITVVAIGKAARPMAGALLDALGARVAGGVVVTKTGRAGAIGPLSLHIGAHPVPGRSSVLAGQAVLACARASSAGHTLVLALSGGASALATVPLPGLSLAALSQTTGALLRAGVDITGINAVRKHLDVLKGGGLALAAAPARVVSLVLSDVVGDALSTVGSGPGVGDPSRWREALAAVSAAPDVPQRVRTIIEEGVRGARPETPAPEDPRLGRARALLIASNIDAVDAARARARALGWLTLGGAPLQGPARVCGSQLARRVAGLDPQLAQCIVVGGETTVEVVGDGIGGRNQELALAAALELSGSRHGHVAALATDGEDGPTDAAGAIVDGQTIAAAEAAGQCAADGLRRNDSHTVLEAANALLRTGPTQTNVGDLALGLVIPGVV